MKDHEAHDDGLDEKEDGVEFVVTRIARDCSGHEAGEVKDGISLGVVILDYVGGDYLVARAR